MKKMPVKIKEKLRQYAKLQLKARSLQREIESMIEEYDVPIENLIACADIYGDEPETEALAYFHNGECDDIEGSIEEIEKVFLYFANMKKSDKI